MNENSKLSMEIGMSYDYNAQAAQSTVEREQYFKMILQREVKMQEV